MAPVPMNEGEHAATRAAGGDVDEPPAGGFAEVHREIGDDEDMIFFGDGAGLGVVFGDGFVLVAEIHLDDLFHVLVQFGELLLELAGLRPDAAVDVAFLVIGQVHEAGEILAEADGIKNGEAELARRMGGEQAENDVVDGADRLVAAGLGRFKKDGALAGIFEQEGDGKIGREGQGQAFVFRQRLGKFRDVHVQASEFRHVFEVRRRRPLFPCRRLPVGKQFSGGGVGGADGFVDGLDAIVSIPSPMPASGSAARLPVSPFSPHEHRPVLCPGFTSCCRRATLSAWLLSICLSLARWVSSFVSRARTLFRQPSGPGCRACPGLLSWSASIPD